MWLRVSLSHWLHGDLLDFKKHAQGITNEFNSPFILRAISVLATKSYKLHLNVTATNIVNLWFLNDHTEFALYMMIGPCFKISDSGNSTKILVIKSKTNLCKLFYFYKHWHTCICTYLHVCVYMYVFHILQWTLLDTCSLSCTSRVKVQFFVFIKHLSADIIWHAYSVM